MAGFIDDFGQKIGGAKKDIWGTRGLYIDDLNDIDLREYIEVVTKDNIWPTPSYIDYLETGMEPACIYFMKTVRDKVCAKITVYGDGKDRERAEKYIQFLHDIKDSCEQVKTIEDIKRFPTILWEGHGYREEQRRWLPKSVGVSGIDSGFAKFIRFSEYDIINLCTETEIQDFPHSFRGDLKGIYIREIYNGSFYIYKGDSRLVRDKSFKTYDEAVQFAKNELIDILDEKKNSKTRQNKTKQVVRPQLEHVERTGPNLRLGHNVTTDHLLKAFKFRGGEFGNWNNQDDRQAYLNYAFDSLVDLGFVLKSPLEFLGFSPLGSYGGQMLAIAFGSRGSGRALAHYECGRVVINLTKLKGAGCLAHEWGHAFDDFLGTRCELSGTKKFLSNARYEHCTSNNDINKAMQNVINTIQQKFKSNDSILEDYKKERDGYINRILKSWIDSDLRYFYTDNGGNRRAPTDEEKSRIDEVIKNLYSTGDRKYYEKYVELHKEIKGILPNKESRDRCDAILRQVEYIDKEVDKYKTTGQFTHQRKEDTSYYKAAKLLDSNRAKAYYSLNEELFARAFEAFIEDGLGFKSQYLVHSTKYNHLYGDLKPYPEGEERKEINKAIAELVKLAVDKFAKDCKQFSYNLYENNQDWTDKYSTQPKISSTVKINQEPTDKNIETKANKDQSKGIKIGNALVEVFIGCMKKVEGDDIDRVAQKAISMLNKTGTTYHIGTDVKYSETSKNGTITCVVESCLVKFNNTYGHIEIKEKIKDAIMEDEEIDACDVRLIVSALEGIEKFNEKDLMRYTQALALTVSKPSQIEKHAEEPVEKHDIIRCSKDLREVLIKNAHDTLPGKCIATYDMLYNIVKTAACEGLKLGYIVEGDIPIKHLKGNSKGWAINNGQVVIDRKNGIEKKLESVIEPVVQVLVMRQFNKEKVYSMISSGVTYMICKKLGLDVRTYCITDEYEEVSKNNKETKAYLNICNKLYKEVISVLNISNTIK